MRRLVVVAFLLAGCSAPAPIPPTDTFQSSPASTAAAIRTPASTPTPTQTPTPTLTPTPSPTPIPPKVVIISIDGLRPDGLLQADAPNILAMAQRGAYTWDAQTTFPPATLPGHASMLTGFAPDAHGVIWNDNYPDRAIAVPTIFATAHAAGLRTVMVVGKEKMQLFNVPGTVDSYVYATEGDRDVADKAIAEIETGFDLMFIHLPNMDFFGHSTGWMSEIYLFEITQTDKAVGRILAALPPDTLVILTADHGGHDKVHGARIPVDMTISWIIAGPGVVADHEIAAPVNTMDTAATVAYVLGLTLAPDAAGVPVLEALGSP